MTEFSHIFTDFDEVSVSEFQLHALIATSCIEAVENVLAFI